MGVALFVIWLLLVFVSFFAFFVPGLGGIFYVALDVLVASLVLMGAGVLISVAGVSGWWGAPTARWGRHAPARRDALDPGQRSGEVFSVVVSAVVLSFFVENQVKGTGFFTPAFGPVEQTLFYGTWLVGVLVSLARAAVGRKNPVRPLSVLYGGMLLATSLVLLDVFPLDFSHLPDLLPSGVRFIFSWVTDPVGKVVLVLGAVGGFATALYNGVLFAVGRTSG